MGMIGMCSFTKQDDERSELRCWRCRIRVSVGPSPKAEVQQPHGSTLREVTRHLACRNSRIDSSQFLTWDWKFSACLYVGMLAGSKYYQRYKLYLSESDRLEHFTVMQTWKMKAWKTYHDYFPPTSYVLIRIILRR